jgi:hypothetical protein
MAAGALIMMAEGAASQSQTPPSTAPMTACPMMQGGMGPGMMGQPGQVMHHGQMMTMDEMKQMHADMRALREDMARLRAELEKHGQR